MTLELNDEQKTERCPAMPDERWDGRAYRCLSDEA